MFVSSTWTTFSANAPRKRAEAASRRDVDIAEQG